MSNEHCVAIAAHLSGKCLDFDVLDRALDKGLVVAGDIKVSLAEVELSTIRIRSMFPDSSAPPAAPRPCWKTDVKPRVGISRCLLGDEVRYDGTHKRDDDLLEALGRQVEWVPVCPEVEIGMGTPREPIQLVASAEGVSSAGERVRLVGIDTGEDWTARMHAWARERVAALQPLKLSGFVLKARSPSCGIEGVRVVGGTTGRGLFAQALIETMPWLPVEDEARLSDARVRQEFLERVRRASQRE